MLAGIDALEVLVPLIETGTLTEEELDSQDTQSEVEENSKSNLD